MKRLQIFEIDCEGDDIAINGKRWDEWTYAFLCEVRFELGNIRMGSEAIVENAPDDQRYLAEEAYREDCRRERLAFCAVGVLRHYFAPTSSAEVALLKIARERGDTASHLERVEQAHLELGCKFCGEAPPDCGDLL